MLKRQVFHVAGHRLIMPSRLKWCKRWSHGGYERSMLEGNNYFTDVAKGNVALVILLFWFWITSFCGLLAPSSTT